MASLNISSINTNPSKTLQETVWRFLKKLNIELLFDPAIPRLEMYSKELKRGTQLLVHRCSQKNYSQEPKGGKTPFVQVSINR